MSSSARDIPSTAYRGHGLDPVTVIRGNQEEESRSGEQVSQKIKSSTLGLLFPEAAGQDVHADLPAGLQLGPYIIESRIGAGGMGAVFKARDEQLDRTVALKVLSPSQASDPSSVRRFHNEAKSAARLDHDNVARIYSIGEDQGLHFIAFEYVAGQTVRELIRERTAIDPFETVNLLLQIAVALKHTAAAGVVHRDIKPSNLIMTSMGKVKLVDWGLARKERLDEQSLDLTVSGTTLGTFDYISPEQARDPRNVDVRSDIYSLGCTAYHMLTGVPPYAEGTVLQKLLDHQGKPTPDPRDRNPNIPRELSRIVKKMMASNPEDRYWTPQALIEDLLEMAAASGLRAIHPDGLTWQNIPRGSNTAVPLRLFWWWLGTFAVACVVAVAFDTWSLQREAEETGGASPLGQYESDGAREPYFSKTLPPVDAGNSTPPQPADQLSLNGSPFDLDSPLPQNTLPALSGNFPAPLTGEISSFRLEEFSVDGAGDEDWSPSVRLDQKQGIARADITGELNLKEESVESDRSDSMKSKNGKTTAPATEAAFQLYSDSGDDLGSYDDLESALEQIPDNGIIEFSRRDAESQAYTLSHLEVVEKAVTIRADSEAPLVLRVDSSQFPSSSRNRQLVTIRSGSLTLQNVHVQFSPVESLSEDWSVFLVDGGGKLRCWQSSVTIGSPGETSSIAVVHMRRSTSQTIDNMSSDDPDSSSEGMVQFEECFFRGAGDLVRSETSGATSVELSRCLITMQGTLLRYLGEKSLKNERETLSLRLSRVTAYAMEGLIRADLGMAIPRQPVDFSTRVEDSIVIGPLNQPMISVAGGLDASTLDQIVLWDGMHNLIAGWEELVALENGNSVDLIYSQLDKVTGNGSRRLTEAFVEQLPQIAMDQWIPSGFFTDLQMAEASQEAKIDLTAYGADPKLLPRIPEKQSR